MHQQRCHGRDLRLLRERHRTHRRHQQVRQDLHHDLRLFIRSYLSTLGAPAARAAIPGLLASYQSTGRSGAPAAWLAVSARPLFRAIIHEAAQGSVDPAVDPDDVFDVLLGAMVARLLIPTVAARNRPIERLVDTALRLLRPASVSGAR